MIKRLFIFLAAALMLFSFNVAAKEASASVEPYGEFFTASENTEKTAEILGITDSELEAYCEENGVELLAVNNDNTKQIRLTVLSDSFSESLGNLSNLSNDEIMSLIPDITGVEGAKGEIINRNGQKFIKTQFRSGDSGGEFTLTQYITVAGKANYVLSFYTDIKQSTDYIENTFSKYSSPDFIEAKEEKTVGIRYIVLAAMIIFAVICIIVAVTIIIDIRKKSEEQ